MININIVCVGALKEKFWIDAVSEYGKRLSRFCKLKILELPQQEKFDKQKCLEGEGDEILRAARGYKILLDIEGKQVTSNELAEKIEKVSLFNSEITFIIGGSYGVSEKVKEQADFRLSFGKITLPHNLARVVLVEQIYRAFMIISGSTYHK